MRLCQWPRLPSDYWKLPQQGYTETECKAFDLLHLEFSDWLEGKRNEVDWVTPSKAHEGKVQRPRYATDADILDLYYARDRSDPAARMTEDDVAELLREFTDWLAEERAHHDGPGEG